MTASHEAAYRGVRERITALCTELSSEEAARTVPATPEWTIKDIVAHLAGVLADIRDGNLAGVGSDPWTAKHVSDREDASLAECLAEWGEVAAIIEPQIPNFPEVGATTLVFDTYSHEQDIRGALAAPGARDVDAARIALDGIVRGLIGRLEGERLGLRIRAADEEWTTGNGSVSLEANPFELLRAISGRRSADQVRALGWDGDPEPYLEVFSQFPMRREPLKE